MATISAYTADATSMSALTSGTVACPPYQIDVAGTDMFVEIYPNGDDVGSDRGRGFDLIVLNAW